jgi:hypothetical protein
MTIATVFPGSAQSNFVKNRDIIFHHGGLADHNGMAVINENPAPDLGRRMDIHGHELAGAGLKIKSEPMLVLEPEMVGNAINLERLETLKKQQGKGHRGTGGVAFAGGYDIGGGGFGQIRIFLMGQKQDLAQTVAMNQGAPQPRTQDAGEGLGQGLMLNDCILEERNQAGFLVGGLKNILPNLSKYRCGQGRVWGEQRFFCGRRGTGA